MRKNNSGYITVSVVLTVLFLIFMIWLLFTTKIPIGYSGIKVNLYGDSKGVNIHSMSTGRNFYNFFTTDVYKYPNFIQQKEYEVRFQDTDGLVIEAKIGMDYKFDEAKISTIFEEYRSSAQKITNEYMATWLRNSINRASATFPVDELYGPKKEDFRLQVLENIQKDFDEKGIHVNNIYFVGDMKLPEQVMSRINAKIEATQNAMQKENELRAVEADAQKQIAEAKGRATAKIEEARGIAEAKLIEAKAQAEANKLINSSLTNTLVEYKTIETWNGVLPTVTGANTLISLPIK